MVRKFEYAESFQKREGSTDKITYVKKVKVRRKKQMAYRMALCEKLKQFR